jgi:hypothetical protein
MAWEQGPFQKLVGHTAGGDLSGSQYRFVKLAANKTVVVCTALTDKPIGVLQNKPTSGQAAEVVMSGATKLVAGADLALGALVGTAADGRAAAKTPGTDVTHYIVGNVLEENTAAGGIVTAQINCVSAARGV